MDPNTVNNETVKIIEQSSGRSIEIQSIIPSNNNLIFTIDLKSNLKYDTIYEIYFSTEIYTFDGRELFWKTLKYGQFRTELRRSLVNIIIDPPDNAVNVPIDKIIVIEFPMAMNRTSVENSINTSFEIKGFNWLEYNMTLIILHEDLQYFTKYHIKLNPGALSENSVFSLNDYLNITFTTITGIITYEFGPFIDKSGDPVIGGTINFLNESSVIIKSGLTNDQGYVKFYFESKLNPGNYTLLFYKNNYESLEWEIVIDQSGEPVNTEPPIIKKETGDDNGSSLMAILGVVIVVVILIIIFIALLYMIVFKASIESEDQPRPIIEKITKIFKLKTPAKEDAVVAKKPDTQKPAIQQTEKDKIYKTPPKQISKMPSVPHDKSVDKKPESEPVAGGQENTTETKPTKNELMDKIKKQ